MTIRRALDAMLQNGDGSDAARPGDAAGAGAGEGPDDSAIRAALDAAGFTDLPTDLVGTAVGHYAETAPVGHADVLAPMATEASSIPFDPELDGSSDSIAVDAASGTVDDDHDADPMDGLDAEPAPDPRSDGPDAAAVDADDDASDATDVSGEASGEVNDEADVVTDMDAAEYGSGSSTNDSGAVDEATGPSESVPTVLELDDVSMTETLGASMDDPFDAFDTVDAEPTSWAERSELHTEDTDLDGDDPTGDGFDDVDIH